MIRAACVFYGIREREFFSFRRSLEMTQARKAVCYAATALTQQSLPAIARILDYRDHTSVLHHARDVRGLITDCKSGKPMRGRDIELLGAIRFIEQQIMGEVPSTEGKP